MPRPGWGGFVVLGTLGAVIASVILVLLGLVFFVVNLWIVKFGSALLGYAPDSNFAVLAATLLTVAGLVGGFRFGKW